MKTTKYSIICQNLVVSVKYNLDVHEVVTNYLMLTPLTTEMGPQEGQAL